MAVSDVAKVLPGYSSRNYKEYAEKVRHVQELLKQAEADRPLDAPPAPPERHEAQPKLGVV